ncbi:hypothetical protein NDU88_012465 [Pleurodeles waltl]|uniref:Uncharacterized protein n=1 Tax=Pleurodeles waltl TaxID=8319 RepID=A0AAV7R206_PLEWA|nr:hypothetical protein NDU88_012465 [Pleurodeles waltl]
MVSDGAMGIREQAGVSAIMCFWYPTWRHQSRRMDRQTQRIKVWMRPRQLQQVSGELREMRIAYDKAHLELQTQLGSIN